MTQTSRSLIQQLLGLRLVKSCLEADIPQGTLIVGGAVRDSLLERSVRDLDLVLPQGSQSFAKRWQSLFGGHVISLGGDEWGATRLTQGSSIIDLWERGDLDRDEDLLRRDLTVNAIGVDIYTGERIDPAQGCEDLEQRQLRQPRPGVFAEDPLRIVRLARFAAELPTFSVDPHTLDGAREALALSPVLRNQAEASSSLQKIAPERLQAEWTRLLDQPQALCGLEILWTTGASQVVAGAAGRVAWHRVATRWRLATQARLAIAPVTGSEKLTLERPLALALLDTLVTEPANHSVTEQAPSDSTGPVASMRARGLINKKDFKAAESLLGALRVLALAAPSSGLPTFAAAPEVPLRWALHLAGSQWEQLFALACAVGETAPHESASRWQELVEASGQVLFSPPTLADGQQVAEWGGLVPGPKLGDLLLEIKKQQVAGVLQTQKDVREFVRRRADRVATESGERTLSATDD